jgi:arrestin-related trafficking adapter 3/6
MLNPTRTHKSSLTITLTEPLVVLRTVNASRFQSQPETMPSMLRGLLALDLAKASKISSIDVELQVVSAPWSEGMFHATFFPIEFV